MILFYIKIEIYFIIYWCYFRILIKYEIHDPFDKHIRILLGRVPQSFAVTTDVLLLLKL